MIRVARALVSVVFLLSLPASALTTAYVTFEHPEGWRCELASGVWICQSSVEPERKDSVVLSIATVATEWDSIDNFENFLKNPKSIKDEEGNTIESKVTYARRRNINGHTWVDSLQYNSELPGFWTRYLATVHKTAQHKVAILITYVVSEEKYSAIAPKFERMVATLKPNAEFDLNVASRQGSGPMVGAEILGPTKDNRDLLRERLNVKKGKGGEEAPPEEGSGMLGIVAVVLVVAGVVLFLRRRRKAKKPSQEP